MAEPLRQLEERVGRAVERIARLTRERAELRREIEGLRERVAQLEAEAGASRREGHEDWERDRERIVHALREVVVELRAE